MAYVQSNKDSNQSVQNPVLVFTGAQTVGNLNVVCIATVASGVTITSVTDTKGNTYTNAIGPIVQGANVGTAWIYTAPITTGALAGANTVTVHFSATVAFPCIYILEYSGVALVDTTGSNSSASGAASVAVTTTNASDTIITCFANSGNSFTAAGTGFTNRVNDGGAGNIVDEKVVASIGTYTDTPSLVAGLPWVAVAVALKAAPALVGTCTARAAHSGTITDPAFEFVQANNANATTSGTTIAAASLTVTSGDLLFVGAEYSVGSTETASIANTGTAGAVTWHALAKYTTSGTGNVLDYFGWWGIAPASGTVVPTVTFSISNSTRGIAFGEWKPGTGKTVGAQDGSTIQTNQSTASTTLAGAAITPGKADDLVIAFYRGGGTLSALASGWINRTMNATLFCGIADCIPMSVSAQTFSATQTSSRGMVQEFAFTQITANLLAGSCSARAANTGVLAATKPLAGTETSSAANTGYLTGPVTATLVQHAATPSGSYTLAFASAQVSGDTNIVIVGVSNTSLVPTVSDNINGAYTQLGVTQLNGFTVGIFFRNNIASCGAGANTVTAAYAEFVTKLAISEWKGLSGATDGYAGGSNFNNAVTSGNLTTTNAKDLLIGAFFGSNWTAYGTGWTGIDTGAGNDIADEYQIVTSTGTSAATFTNTGGNYWCACIGAFALKIPSLPLVGTESSRAANSGALTVIRPLAGTGTAKAANSGVLRATKLLAGIEIAHAANTGTIAATKPLVGTCTTKGASSGALRVARALAGTCTARASIIGLLNETNLLSEVCSAKASNSGILRATKPLSGSAIAHPTFLMVGTLSEANVLSGTSNVRGSNTGILAAIKPLAAVCYIHLSSAALLRAAKKIAGICTGQAANTGTLRATKPLAGTSTASAASTGTLRGGKVLAGINVCRSANSGALTVVHLLIGTESSHAAHSGVLFLSHPLVGTDTVKAANIGALAAAKPIAGTCTARGSSTGTISSPKQLGGTCTVHAANSGTVFQNKVLSGTATATAINTGLLRASKPLAAVCTVQGASSGVLRAFKILAGTDTAHAANSGLLRTTIPFAGICTVRSANTGALASAKVLAGLCTVRASNTGALSSSAKLSGTCTAQASHSGAIKVLGPLAGTCTIRLASASTLQETNALKSTSSIHSTITALLRASKPLAGTDSVHAANTGLLSKVIGFAGIDTVKGANSGALSVKRPLVGSDVVRAANSGSLGSGRTLAGNCLIRPSITGLLTQSNRISGTDQARALNTGMLRATIPMSGTCVVSMHSSGIISIVNHLIGSCAVHAVNHGQFISGGLLAGTCRVRAANSGIFGATKRLAGPCVERPQISGTLRAFKLLAGNCTVLPINTGLFVAIKPLAGQIVVRLASSATLQARKLLAGPCTARSIDFGYLLVIIQPTSLSGQLKLAGHHTGSLTRSGAQIVTSLSGTVVFRGTGKGTVFVPPRVPVQLHCVCTVHPNKSSKGTLTNHNSPAGLCRVKLVGHGTFALPMLFYQATCTIRASSTGTLILVANPVQHRSPVKGIFPLPLITDIEQMPIQMLLAYSAMYELPTVGLQAAEIAANLKAIRWISQGDVQMVTPAELLNLWNDYGIEPGSVNVPTQTMAIILTQFLFGLYRRHNAWGYCSNATGVRSLLQSGGQHSSKGTCLITVVVESET